MIPDVNSMSNFFSDLRNYLRSLKNALTCLKCGGLDATPWNRQETRRNKFYSRDPRTLCHALSENPQPVDLNVQDTID